MNLHAKKIVQESSAEYEINTYQGRLLEFHACPNCGAAAIRHAGG